MPTNPQSGGTPADKPAGTVRGDEEVTPTAGQEDDSDLES